MLISLFIKSSLRFIVALIIYYLILCVWGEMVGLAFFGLGCVSRLMSVDLSGCML